MYGTGRYFKVVAVVATIALLGGAVVYAADGPAVQGAEVQCILNAPFPQISGTTLPGADIEAARLFFKSGDQSDFYWVPMTREGDSLTAVLPQPLEETRNVVYFVETVDSSETVSRTPEYDAAVVLREWDCRGGKVAATFNGPEPHLVVGSTSGGTAVMPVGFAPTGIIGTVSPEGMIAAVGSNGEESPVDLGSLVGDEYIVGGGIALLADRDVEEPSSPSAP